MGAAYTYTDPFVRAALSRVLEAPTLETVQSAILELGEVGVAVLDKVAPDIVRAQVQLAALEAALKGS